MPRSLMFHFCVNEGREDENIYKFNKISTFIYFLACTSVLSVLRTAQAHTFTGRRIPNRKNFVRFKWILKLVDIFHFCSRKTKSLNLKLVIKAKQGRSCHPVNHGEILS